MRAVIGTPLAVERWAVPGAVRLGMGARTALPAGDAFLVAGLAGGLNPAVRPGDVVVAPDASAPLLAGALRRLGLAVHVGPVHTSDRVVTGAERARLAGTGALAVDMETDRLRAAAGDRPFATARVVTDAVGAALWSPGTLLRGVRGLLTLRTAAPALRQWAAATGGREVRLAPPRSCCAGVADTTDGQQAVRTVARECDLVLVVDRANSSHSARLVEAAERAGVAARSVADAEAVDLGWLPAAGRVGIVAGASAPPAEVDNIVASLAGLGPVTVLPPGSGTENMQFTLPRGVS
ncbi:hypothetical protein ACFFWC_09005 [Plantactinospora siamensis]|uniref:Uncharacterized protein n=1 Tax=Plantactinospora siamensis TaxID=555372 RepID=A0ABV6P5R9_9ACTN